MLVDAVETEVIKQTEARAMVWMVFMTVFLVLLVQRVGQFPFGLIQHGENQGTIAKLFPTKNAPEGGVGGINIDGDVDSTRRDHARIISVSSVVI